MAYIPRFPGKLVKCISNELEFLHPGQATIPNESSGAVRLVRGPNAELLTAGVATLEQSDQVSQASANALRRFFVQSQGQQATVRIPLWTRPNPLMQVVGSVTANPLVLKALDPTAVLTIRRVTAQSTENLGEYVQCDVQAQVNGVDTGVVVGDGAYWVIHERLNWAYRSRNPDSRQGYIRSFFRSHPLRRNPGSSFNWKPGAVGTGSTISWYNGGETTAEGADPRPLYIVARLRESEARMPESDYAFGPYVLAWIEDEEYLAGQEAARGASGNTGGQSSPEPRHAYQPPPGESEFDSDEDPDWEDRIAEAAHRIFDEGRETAEVERHG